MTFCSEQQLTAMKDFIFNYYLMPFHISVILLIALSIFGSINVYVGYRPRQWFRHWLPAHAYSLSFSQIKFSHFLVFIFFLINFSFAGYFLQLLFFASRHYFLSPYYLILPAIFIAIFFTVFMVHCLDQVILPHRSLEHHQHLIGRLATVCNATARPGQSSQARVRDEFGQLHYVLIEPEFGELPIDSQVILIEYQPPNYIAKKIVSSNYLFDQEL